MNEPEAIKYPYVTVTLTGVDGNVFFLIGTVRVALRSAGVPAEEITEFSRQAMGQGSYDGREQNDEHIRGRGHGLFNATSTLDDDG